jgi:hypothetical protein
MDNNRGSAIALVLMILAVVSLIGVGLISLSRMDVKFTAALKSYDKMFNLADGASTRAFYDLKSRDREQDTNFVGKSVRLDNIYPNPLDSTKPPTEPLVGDYSVNLILDGYSTEPSSGWELGTRGYYQEYWIGEGQGIRTSGQLVIEAATTKSKQKY